MKLKISDISEYIMVFVLIYATDSFIVFANLDTRPKVIFKVIMVATAIYMLYKLRFKFEKKFKLFFFLISECLILFTMVMNRGGVGGDFTKMFVIFWGYLYTELYEFKRFKKIFCDWMVVIAGFSLVTFLLRKILIPLFSFSTVSNVGWTLISLGLSNLFVGDGSQFVRNWGPFWEPGVFQCYLNIALLFLGIEEIKSKPRMLVLIIAIVSTFSTTGFICLGGVLLIILFTEKPTEIQKNKLWIVMLFLIGVAVVIQNSSLREILFSKFTRTSSSFESFRSRYLSVCANLYVIKQSPIWGVGVSGISKLYGTFMNRLGIMVYSNTNGLLLNFAAYGCVLGLLYTYGYFCFSKLCTQHIVNRLILFGLVLLILFSEPFLQSLLFNTIVFYGFIKGEKDRNENYVVDEC